MKIRAEWQVVWITVGALLVLALVAGYLHYRSARAGIEGTVKWQIDGHERAVADILQTKGGFPGGDVEDAIFGELQKTPSSSLIERWMIKVEKTPTGKMRCVIDTTARGVPPRVIE